MRTLFVTYHYLHGNGGGVFASRGYINAFAGLSERLTLLCPVKDGISPEGIAPSVRVIPVRYEKPQWLKFVDLLLGKIHRFLGVFDQVLVSEPFDLVVFDTSYVSFRLIRKAQRKGCRVITIHHNFQCDYVRDNYQFPVRLPLIFWTRICERDAVRNSDLNLVLTEADRLSLARAYDPEGKAEIRIVGIFEYRKDAELPIHPLPEGSVFVATGDLSMRQTVEPFLEWIRDDFPILREEVPDAKVIVAGKNPKESLIRACSANGIEVVASPEDMGTILRRGRYYLCPSSKGGGIKLRLLDGLKYGMPVLAHEVSARGYEPFVRRDIYCYNTPDSFRHALREMLASPVDAGTIVRHYQDAFSFESGIDRLQGILDSTIMKR